MPFGRLPISRSEPKASTMKPRDNSCTENFVNSGGAPAKEPGGAGCLPDAANPGCGTSTISARAAMSLRMTVASLLAPDAHQAFLCDGSDQRAVTLEDQAAREAAPAMQIGRILRVQKPFVGAERPVQPERVIEARRHEFLFEQ